METHKVGNSVASNTNEKTIIKSGEVGSGDDASALCGFSDVAVTDFPASLTALALSIGSRYRDCNVASGVFCSRLLVSGDFFRRVFRKWGLFFVRRL